MNGVIKAFSDLKKIGFRSCAIISVPDYNGGHMDHLIFSYDPDEDWWENLDPFNYVEWSGSVADLYKEWPDMTCHREIPEEVDYEIDLFSRVLDTLEEFGVDVEVLGYDKPCK